MAIHRKVLIDEVGELGPLEGSLKRHLAAFRICPICLIRSEVPLINMLKPS